jgi:hypothetical protein
MQYEIVTQLLADDRIAQDVNVVNDTLPPIHETIIREVFNIREQQLREALIKLGWTPPTGIIKKEVSCAENVPGG